MRQRGIFEKVSGSGVWSIRYVDAQGRYRREKAGTKSAAIALYRKRKQQALEGRKLPEKLRRAPVTFREIAEDALTWSGTHKRSAQNDRYRMAKLLDWLGDKPAESVTPQEIEEHLQSKPWHPATWNRVRALLSMVYRIAIRNGKVSQNPADLYLLNPRITNGFAFFLLMKNETFVSPSRKNSQCICRSSISPFTLGCVYPNNMGRNGSTLTGNVGF